MAFMKRLQMEVGSEEERNLKFKIWKNVLLISLAFFLLFTSYNSMSNLMPSLHKQLGNLGSSTVYAGLIGSCTILPTFLLKYFRPKTVITFAILLYCPYMACLFIPSYYSFVPTGFLLGLAASPLWVSKCIYLTKISSKYSAITGESVDLVISKFFGIFFVFFQVSQIVGNYMSSAVLSRGVENFTRTEDFLEHCGINYCPSFGANLTTYSNENSTDNVVNDDKITIITSIYLALTALGSSVVWFFVDPVARFLDGEQDLKNKSVCSTLLGTIAHLKHPNQVLLLPITIWSGLEQGFLSSEIMAGFVSCGLGVHMLGYTLVAYGVADAISCYASTYLVKHLGRIVVFTVGSLLNAIVLAVIFLWKPNPTELIVFFLLPIIWGASDGVWQTQINAFYGIIFPHSPEGAFSNYRLWESIGFFINYMGAGFWCVRLKSFILISFLVSGMIGYYTVELKESLRKRK